MNTIYKPPIVPLEASLSIGPNVAPLSPLNTITGSELVWFVSHQLTITLSMVASTSKAVELEPVELLRLALSA